MLQYSTFGIAKVLYCTEPVRLLYNATGPKGCFSPLTPHLCSTMTLGFSTMRLKRFRSRYDIVVTGPKGPCVPPFRTFREISKLTWESYDIGCCCLCKFAQSDFVPPSRSVGGARSGGCLLSSADVVFGTGARYRRVLHDAASSRSRPVPSNSTLPNARHIRAFSRSPQQGHPGPVYGRNGHERAGSRSGST